MRNRPAFTLLELAVVLTVLGGMLALALPHVHRARHALAVRAARIELATAFAAARAAAVRGGGATLVVEPAAASAWIEVGADAVVVAEYRLGAHYGVRVETGSGTRTEVRYDALGVGRLANATIGVRRGDVYAALTVSAYGRVRL